MVIRLGIVRNGRSRRDCAACAAWAFAAAATLAAPIVPAQRSSDSASHEPPPIKERFLTNKFPDKPSLPPTWSVPVDPLGFTAPGAIYLGARYSLVSLDFIDEDRLLFTFRVPGLLHRNAANGDDSEERQIRSIVLKLPEGSVEAQASWTVHDRYRYVWMLKNGHFLLRDRNNLLVGDATLKVKPFLDFPGPLLVVDLDPDQHFLVTNSQEAPAAQKSAAADSSDAVASPEAPASSTASASVTSDNDSAKESDRPDYVVRILRRDSGKVMLVSRVRNLVHLPINSEGYLENLRGRGADWALNLSYFTGGTKILGSVDSACAPEDDFVSEEEILVTGCGANGESKLMAMTTAGRTLWISQAPASEVWPHLTLAPNGLRLAWETLDANHSVNSYAPLDSSDIKEQSVTVFDAATGDITLVSPLSPIFDAGGNVAISPSGRRVALLNAGAIQVFELPAPPSLAGAANPLSGK